MNTDTNINIVRIHISQKDAHLYTFVKIVLIKKLYINEQKLITNYFNQNVLRNYKS